MQNECFISDNKGAYLLIEKIISRDNVTQLSITRKNRKGYKTILLNKIEVSILSDFIIEHKLELM